MKVLREGNKKTQNEVAKYLNISRQAYTRYESGSREPGLETISKLAEFYKVPVQTFFMSTDIVYKYENLFMTELSALYDRKYKEVMNISDYLHFNQIEKEESFPYDKKNQVSEEELKKYESVFTELLSQLDMLGKEIIKSIHKDREYFSPERYKEFLDQRREYIKNKK